MRPVLFTFDIFGTVLDWRRGLQGAASAAGRELSDADFDRVVDAQGADEQTGFRPYREIVSRSLMGVSGMPAPAADVIGEGCGRWPLYPDSRAALSRLRRVAPCVAMTNSDRAHRDGVESQLGFALDGWICAEEVRLYKPNPGFWIATAVQRSVAPGPAWWHVSAYADYDLTVARSLGLTCVYVTRPHARPGPADHVVPDLAGLADLLEESFLPHARRQIS